ncbi:MAG: 4Fe-4S dicluster domain-containing protein [Dissulfurispiraceae bacterium]
MTTEAVQPWRRIAEILQAVLILGLPFLKIGGESALRFDVPSLRLHFFGVTLWMEEFFVVLIGVIFLAFFIVLITILFGRVWCGWLCPQTVLVDFSRFIDRLDEKSVGYKVAAYSAIFAISALAAANLIWYFVSPYEFIGRLISGDLGSVLRGFWIAMTGIMFLNFAFLRHRFCVTVCPYAKVQSVMFDNKTLVIAFDDGRKEECMNCGACVKTCPVDIDIRKGLDSACINCAECIDACVKMMGRRQKKGLIGYSFGLPGEAGKLVRQNVILIGSIVLASLLFLIYLSLSRVSIDMTVLPNSAFSPRINADGTVLNAYVLSLENRGESELDLYMSVKDDEGTIKMTPDSVLLAKGENRKVPVYVSLRGNMQNGMTKSITFVLESRGPAKMHISKKANFVIPGVGK